ncbi:hypothetical protein K9L16_02325 [Candidatus Pacearchaeota archaeon]|nr:hypothetical protein [Candidatus Pacearchaeota archaeon]
MKKKNLKLIIASFLFFISLFIIIFVIYISSNVIEKQEIFVELVIGNKSGFNLDPGKISFGEITYSSNSERKIYLKNNYDFPVKVELLVEGNITQFLNYKNQYFIEPGKTEIATINAQSPEYAKLGYYSGNLIIKFKRDL